MEALGAADGPKNHSVGKLFHGQEEIVVVVVTRACVCKEHPFNLLLSHLASTCFLSFLCTEAALF